MALALRGHGFGVQPYDGFLEVFASEEAPPLRAVLEGLANGGEARIFEGGANLIFEKFHPWLTDALLRKDALSSRLDPLGLPALCRSLLRS